MKARWICLLVMPAFKPGDPAPAGYLQWHEWARAQLRGGLRQKRCKYCGLFVFPQEYEADHKMGECLKSGEDSLGHARRRNVSEFSKGGALK